MGKFLTKVKGLKLRIAVVGKIVALRGESGGYNE